MQPLEPGEAKPSFRAAARERRAPTSPADRAAWSEAILERVAGLDAYRDAAAIHTFIGALEGEVETRPMADRVLREGKRLVLPRVEGDRLVHHAVPDLDDLVQNRIGLWEPDPARHERFEAGAIDLVLVPGLAFDRQGYRIGYGAGYYDRFLAELTGATSVGLAFTMQLVPRVPREPHDLPVDLVVTEREVIEARAAR